MQDTCHTLLTLQAIEINWFWDDIRTLTYQTWIGPLKFAIVSYIKGLSEKKFNYRNNRKAKIKQMREENDFVNNLKNIFYQQFWHIVDE